MNQKLNLIKNMKYILLLALAAVFGHKLNKITLVDKDGVPLKEDDGFVPHVEFNENHPSKEVVGGEYTQAKIAAKNKKDFWIENAKSDTPYTHFEPAEPVQAPVDLKDGAMPAELGG